MKFIYALIHQSIRGVANLVMELVGWSVELGHRYWSNTEN